MTALQPMNWETEFGLHKNSFDRRTSCPNAQIENQGNSCKPRKHSTPNFESGIPLGSLTAQLASKSFWNQQMLNSSIEKIAECAAKESSSLGSSMESLSSSDGVFEENIIQVSEESAEEVRSNSTPLLQQFMFETIEKNDHGKRALRHPLEKTRSVPLTYSRRSGENTPPYLSPGVTKRRAYK